MPSLAERISREQEEDQAESREHVSEAHSPGGAQAHTLLSASVEAEGETRSGAESSVEQTQESEELRETEEIAQELARVGGGSQAAGGGGKSRGKKALGGLKTAGKAVGMGLLNTLLGPLQFVSKSYRKQQVATWKKEYENPALNALQKISTVVSQIGGIAAWGGLITGLTAAILAATGVGIPIAAGFAAASSILCFTSTVALAANAGVKGMQAIGGLIQSTAHTGTKASEIRARALSDFLKGLASLGGAMVGGYMAQANGGSFATTIDSQVQGATTTATGMASQGGTAVGDFGLKSLAGQGFNNAGDLLVAGADAGEDREDQDGHGPP